MIETKDEFPYYILFKYCRDSTGSVMYRVIQSNSIDTRENWQWWYPGEMKGDMPEVAWWRRDKWRFVESWTISHDRRNEILQAFQNEPWPVEVTLDDRI